MSNPTLHSFLNGRHSKQAVFTYVYNKILEQGKASIVNRACAYRGKDGVKCGVGHLVTDRDFASALKYRCDHKWENTNDPMQYEILNGMGIVDFIKNLGFYGLGTNDERVHFLVDLQEVHDDAAENKRGKSNTNAIFIHRFKKGMQKLAMQDDLVL